VRSRTGGSDRHFGASGHDRGPVAGARTFGSDRHFGSRTSPAALPRRVATAGHYFYHGRSFQRFQANYYRWPRGYSYVRYGIGGYLPRYYWVTDYYITDYAYYGLDPAPYGFVWMRYGPDVVLFNLETGLISSIIYGAFLEASVPENGGDDSGDYNDGGDQ